MSNILEQKVLRLVLQASNRQFSKQSFKHGPNSRILSYKAKLALTDACILRIALHHLIPKPKRI